MYQRPVCAVALGAATALTWPGQSELRISFTRPLAMVAIERDAGLRKGRDAPLYGSGLFCFR